MFRLGFLGDFLSASVLIGFLTGVGVQVLTGQIPDMLGVPKGTGNWFQQQWTMITVDPRHQLGRPSPSRLGTLAHHPRLQAVRAEGSRRHRRGRPVIASRPRSTRRDGVAVVGAVQGGFPPIGLPQGIS